MNIPAEKIESELLSLPRHTRARIIERVIASLDDDPEIEQAWIEESQRRYARFEAGETEAVPAEEVLERARARLRRR